MEAFPAGASWGIQEEASSPEAASAAVRKFEDQHRKQQNLNREHWMRRLQLMLP
jgi:hypothetical protein